jgi:site-specific DNA recombinase
MVNAVGLIRLSKTADPSSTSIERQQESIEAFCAAQGLTLMGLAIDRATSAFHVPPERRRAVREWLDKPDAYDAVVYYRADRVVRRTQDFMGLVSWCKANGKMLLSATEGGGDMAQHAGILIGFLAAWSAESESMSTSERVKSSQARLAQEGRWRGGRPSYGMKAVRRKGGPGFELTPDEGGSADIIRTAVQRIIGGSSVNSVIADFNMHGVRAADGGLWSAHSMRKILRNRSLMNVITPDEWVAVQEALSARTIRHPPTTSSNPLLGLVSCGLCGSVIYRWHRKRDDTYHGRCKSEMKRAEVTTPCSMPMIPWEILEEAVALDMSDHADLLIERRVVSPGGTSKLRADDISRALLELPGKLASKSISREEFMSIQKSLLDELDGLAQDAHEEPQWITTGETVGQLWARSGPDERRAWLVKIGVSWTVYREDSPSGTAYRWVLRGAWRDLDDTAYLERVRRPG